MLLQSSVTMVRENQLLQSISMHFLRRATAPYVDGMDVSKEENVIPVRKSAGMVFQNPDNQIIANVVEEDVGFGPENIGVPTDEIWQRVDYALRLSV